MINIEPALLDAVIIMIISGSIYSWFKMGCGLVDFLSKRNIIKELRMNIFDVKNKPLNSAIDSSGDTHTVGVGYPIFAPNDEGMKQWENYQRSLNKGADSQQDGKFFSGDPDAAKFYAGDPNFALTPPVKRAAIGVDYYRQRAPEKAIPLNYINTIGNEAEMREALSTLIFSIEQTGSEDELWLVINGYYCQLSYGKPREKAEIIRAYFRKLDQVFKRKDGTLYSKVVSPEVAKEIIEELIEVYPWDVPIKVEPIKHAQDEKRIHEIDALKESVSDLMSVISEINDRLDKIK